MARKPLTGSVDLDGVEKADGVIVQIGRGSVPPPEPTVTDQVREFLRSEEEREPYYEHLRTSRPAPRLRTNLGEVAMRAFAVSENDGQSGGF